MSSLAFPEVASRTMVASALQSVQHDDKLWLAALVLRRDRDETLVRLETETTSMIAT